MKYLKTEMETNSARRNITSAFIELRNALVNLSIALKDWEFESDEEQRKNAEDKAQKFLDQMRNMRKQEPDA